MIRSGVFLLKLLFSMVPSDPSSSSSASSSSSQPLQQVEASSPVTPNWMNVTSVSNQSNLPFNLSHAFTSIITKRSLVNALADSSLKVVSNVALHEEVSVANLPLTLTQSVSSAVILSSNSLNWSQADSPYDSTNILSHNYSNDPFMSTFNSITMNGSSLNSSGNVTNTSPYTLYDSLSGYEYELFASTNVSSFLF